MLRLGFGRFLLPLGFAVLLASTRDGQAGGRDEDLFLRPEDQRNVLFSSFEGSRSVFFSAGAKQALTGPLDRPGFLLMESSGFGLTRERIGGDLQIPALRISTQATSLLGYQWMVPGLYVAALAGPEFEYDQLTVAGRIGRLEQPRFGARGQVEIWSNPSRDTLLTETLVLGSNRGSLYTRSSAGYRVGGSLYAGPEVTIYATDTYRETKWGAHLTGIDWGIVHFRASGGWMLTDDGRPGTPYIGLTGWIRM